MYSTILRSREEDRDKREESGMDINEGREIMKRKQIKLLPRKER